MKQLEIRKTHKNARLPVRRENGLRELIIFSQEPTTIPANEHILMNTGIKIILADGLTGYLRTFQSLRTDFLCCPSAITSKCETEVQLILENNTNRFIHIKKFQPVATVSIHETVSSSTGCQFFEISNPILFLSIISAVHSGIVSENPTIVPDKEIPTTVLQLSNTGH